VDLTAPAAPGPALAAPGAAAGGEAGRYIPGIAQALPPGEQLLWFGRPGVWAIAKHVFHLRALGLYFAAMIGIWAVNRAGAEDFLRQGAVVVGLSAAALGLLATYAYFIASTTVYAITDRRVVMKIGVALDLTLNIPLGYVQNVALRRFRDGTGQIALQLPERQKLAYAILWPHARPWRVNRPEPMLRGLADPGAVGDALRRALEQTVADPEPTPAV
jgi:hypothetical protein